MTYDLYVLRVEPGQDWQDALADQVGGGDEPEWPPAELEAGELRAWHRIVERVHSEVGPVTGECTATRAELALEEPSVRLDYFSDHAAVKIPFGYSGAAALRALHHGYRIAGIVADETNTVAVDPRIGRRLPRLAALPGGQPDRLAS